MSDQKSAEVTIPKSDAWTLNISTIMGPTMQRRGRGKKRPIVREAALDRIESLYDLAFNMARAGEMNFARRYLKLARKIGMRYTVRIPIHLKRMTCKNCLGPLLPGITSRSRLRSGRKIITCLECGHVSRYPHTDKEYEEEEEDGLKGA
jgi:ribonuclease P protein subunit RPR2